MNTENDELKRFYERDAARFWSPKEGLRGRDLSIYPLLKGSEGRILDYGAGSGSLILNLATEKRFSDVYAVDLSMQALQRMQVHWTEMAKSHGAANDKVKFIQAIDDKLAMIDDNSLDVVLTLDTLEHVINPYTVLDELYRVTKKGGRLIVSVPNYGYIKYVMQLFWGIQPITGSGEPVSRWRHAGWDGWHLHTFTKQGLSILLRDCGWTIERWSGYGAVGGKIGLNALRKKLPSFFSGALTVECRKRYSNE